MFIGAVTLLPQGSEIPRHRTTWSRRSGRVCRQLHI